MKTNVEAYAECAWCGRPIYHGNAYVCIDHHVEQADWDEELEGAAITVVHAESLLILCGACGNRLDTRRLAEALSTPEQFSRPRPTDPSPGSASWERGRRLGARASPPAWPHSTPQPPKHADDDEEEDGGPRAWMEYPPEAEAYGEYLRAVMRHATGIFERLGQFTDAPPADLITNAVIDYESAAEGCSMHQGLDEAGERGGWWDPSYSHVGTCSRCVRPPTPLEEAPYPASLHGRAFSMVTLDRPTWIPPNDEGSFYQQVIEPLVNLPGEEDHLYRWLDIFFAFARGKFVAYYSRYDPGERIEEIARKHEVQLFLMPLDVIPEGVREQHRHFRFLYVTRAQWEALLAGLECGGQGGV
jgi:hypothetical protein